MKKCAAIFFQTSLVCAVLSVALVSLDECPWWPVAYFPARPSYFVALTGVFFWLLSGRWYREAPRHKILLVCVLAALLWSTIATVCGSLERKPGHLVFDYLFFYMNWRVWPLVFLTWIALAFSELKNERIAKLLSFALVLLFLPNLLHAILEILANAGATDVKDFLIKINHFFRKEKIAHGWWPPVFFEGRVRGLFAEPSHMAFSLLPLFGYFSYKLRQNRLFLLPLAALVAMYICGQTYSGLIGIGALCLFLVVFDSRLRPSVRLVFAITVVVLGLLGLVAMYSCAKISSILIGFGALCAFLLFLNSRLRVRTRVVFAVTVIVLGMAGIAAGIRFLESGGFHRTIAIQLHNIEVLSRYCATQNVRETPPAPVLDYSKNVQTSLFTRLTAMRLDIDAALHAPLVGTGFFQKGFYWAPLSDCDFHGAEFGLWVRQAAESPFHGVPQLSEYTTLMAEFGFPGLFFFLLLYFFIGKGALQSSKKYNDRFLFCMTCSYWAMLVDALFISLINTVLFFYLAGFLYALGPSADRAAPHMSDYPRKGHATAR